MNKEDLVGKWVVKTNRLHQAPFDFRPYLVTKVSGSRVYTLPYKRKLIDGKMQFTTTTPSQDEEEYFQIGSVYAVFNSVESCISCINTCEEEYKYWYGDLRFQMQEFCKGNLAIFGKVYK